MGIISLEKSNRLIWLGRYAERTFTISRTLMRYFDEMIDHDGAAYRSFLNCLGLPDIYGSREAFVETYFFDEGDPNSIAAQLTRALDNAVEMREELTSETLSYIQMAQNALRNRGVAPLIILQRVVDDLFAFWGSADDNIVSESCRTLLKCGKYVERLDLYIRLNYSFREVEKETDKLLNRLGKAHFAHRAEDAEKLAAWTKDEATYQASRQEIMQLLWTLLA